MPRPRSCCGSIEPLLADPERYGAAIDPKTSLQELASRTGATPPVYAVTSTGPDHDRALHRDGHAWATSRREGTGIEQEAGRDGRRTARVARAQRDVPELPEVEVVRAGLDPAVTGATVLGVHACSTSAR